MIDHLTANQPEKKQIFQAFVTSRERLSRENAATLTLANLGLLILDQVSSTMDISKLLLRGEGIGVFGLDRKLENVFGEELAKVEPPFAILAFQQTQGRGREGRSWHSPARAGIYVSYVFTPENRLVSIPGYSLAIGVAICRTLASFGVKGLLKWPNDVLVWEEQERTFKKIAGTLIEVLSVGENISGVIVGLGLNLFPADYPEKIAATCLAHISAQAVIYEEVFVELTKNVITISDHFFRDGFSAFRSEWLECSMICGARVRAEVEGKSGEFLVRGVDSQGGLVVCGEHGEEHIIVSSRIELIDVARD